jgi:lipopolysaccharide export system protein LptA
LLGIAGGMLLLSAGSAFAYWQTSDSSHAAAALGATLVAPTGGAQNGTATPGSIPIKWTAPTGYTPTGYIVLRCGTPSCTPGSSPSVGGCSAVITSTVTATSCLDSDTSLAQNTTYTYVVEAVLDNWTSTASASFTGQTTAISKLVFTAQPTSGQQFTAAATNLPTLTVAVEDSAGATATNDNSGTVTLSIATGPTSTITCTSPSSLTANIASGLATFTGCAITKAGTYTLQATSTGLTTATSNSFQIVAGSAKQLVFTAQPTPGQQIAAAAANLPALTVAVQDQFGNTLTSDSGRPITLSIASGPGSITCTSPSSLSENDSSGLASFTGCAITKAGTYTLQATSTGLTTATSNSFQIVAGSAKQLVFTAQPTPGQQIAAAAANLPALTVAVQDQFGNTLTSDSGRPITLSIASGPGSITCTSPSSLSENDSSGLASFTGCAITKAGTYTLQATSTGLTTATSNSFSIIGGAPDYLSFTNVTIPITGATTPTCSPNTSAHTNSCTINNLLALASYTANVSMYDQYGNPTTYTSAVTVNMSTDGLASVSPATLTIPAGSSQTSATFTETLSLGIGTATASATVNSVSMTATITPGLL